MNVVYVRFDTEPILCRFDFLNVHTFDGDVDSYVHGSTTHLVVSPDTDTQVSLFQVWFLFGGGSGGGGGGGSCVCGVGVCGGGGVWGGGGGVWGGGMWCVGWWYIWWWWFMVMCGGV